MKTGIEEKTMKEYKRILIVFSLLSLWANVSFAVANAGILSTEDAQVANAEALRTEVSIFKSILEGLTLSVAQCDKVEACMPDASSGEVQQLMSTLDQRIESLGQRQQDADSGSGLEAVLVAYKNEREDYAQFLGKLGSGSEDSSVIEDIDESELFGNEEDKADASQQPEEGKQSYDVFSDEDEDL